MSETVCERIRPLVDKWLDWDKDPVTRKEIEQLRDDENWSELDKRLGTNIQFGTAGLRGRMQAGFAFMNSLTVISASQGIAEYMLSSMKHESARDLSVLIGHDTRHQSNKFANIAAAVFSSKGISVFFYKDYVPTPFVAFGVNHFGTDVGVMITASHNPAQDNGYKVYWSNGCQINTPVDQQIATSIAKYQKPRAESWSEFKQLQKRNLLPEVTKAYLDRLRLVIKIEKMPRKPFAYTPMHGVGQYVMDKIVREVSGWPMRPVPGQTMPDPDFPTVKFPNPEEAGALDLAYQTAEAHKLDTVVANDPDADRVAVAERIGDGHWHKFTGDQLGVLLASYLLESEATRPTAQKVVLLASAVSSGMLEKMVALAGDRFQFEETLTGFKWIGNRARSFAESGVKALFGYEEALGYMLPAISYDKDGLAAAALYLSARAHWTTQGLTPYQKLHDIYKEIGYHESINTYFVSPNPATTKEVFERIRGSGEVKDQRLGSYKFEKWRDVTNGSAKGDWGSRLEDKGSQMLSFVLAPDSDTMASRVTFTLRGSGTEPKLKLYLEASSSDSSTANAQAVEVTQLLISNWIFNFGPNLTYSKFVTSSSGRTIEL